MQTLDCLWTLTPCTQRPLQCFPQKEIPLVLVKRKIMKKNKNEKLKHYFWLFIQESTNHDEDIKFTIQCMVHPCLKMRDIVSHSGLNPVPLSWLLAEVLSTRHGRIRDKALFPGTIHFADLPTIFSTPPSVAVHLTCCSPTAVCGLPSSSSSSPISSLAIATSSALVEAWKYSPQINRGVLLIAFPTFCCCFFFFPLANSLTLGLIPLVRVVFAAPPLNESF